MWLKEETLRCGWGEATWLFWNEAGRPMDKGKVEQVFHRIRKRAKLPHFRPYDLRHTFASLLLAARAPITYVSAQLGHANPTTTLRYYARWIPTKGLRWVDVLDGAGAAPPAALTERAQRLSEAGSGHSRNQNQEPNGLST